MKHNKTQQKWKQSVEVLSWGSCYALSTYRPDLLSVSSFILWVAVCGRSVRSLVIACGAWREKMCEKSLGDNSGILGIFVKYYGEIV